MERKEWPATDCRRGGPKVQLRYPTELTFAEYVKAEAWQHARLESCPLCPPGQCRLARHGTYQRKVPAPARVARFYCPTTHTTIGLLPDFYASRLRGTLPALEEAVAQAEQAPSVEAAANALRPAEADDAVTLPTALRWVRRRLAMVRATLTTVRGLFPTLLARCQLTVRSFRDALDPQRAGGAARDLRPLPAHVARPARIAAPAGRGPARGSAANNPRGEPHPRPRRNSGGIPAKADPGGSMNDDTSKRAEAVALFRYGLIADFLHPPAEQADKTLYERLREKAAGRTASPAPAGRAWPSRRCATGWRSTGREASTR